MRYVVGTAGEEYGSDPDRALARDPDPGTAVRRGSAEGARASIRASDSDTASGRLGELMAPLRRDGTRHSPYMLRVILLALALSCSGAATSAARESVVLQPDTRVRLSVSTSELIRVLSGTPLTAKQLRRDQFIGTLKGRRDDDVVILVGSPETELAVPVKSVVRLESSRGIHGCAGEGAATGLAAGAVAGAGIGAIIGSQMRCEHWRAIPIKDLPYGDGSPREDGIRLGLNLPLK